MVEGEDEELVGRVEQLEQKPVDGGARILNPLAEHAVADVDEDAEAHRHALVGELRDLLQRAVLVHLEDLAAEAGDEPPLFVGHRRGDARDLDAGLKPGLKSEV